jgi:hypothetical protein
LRAAAILNRAARRERAKAAALQKLRHHERLFSVASATSVILKQREDEALAPTKAAVLEVFSVTLCLLRNTLRTIENVGLSSPPFASSSKDVLASIATCFFHL